MSKPATEVRKELIKETYDLSFAHAYDAPIDALDEYMKIREMEWVFNNIEIRPAMNSLDIGTATGRYPLTLARFGVNAIGIDFSSGMLKFALTKAKKDDVLISLILQDVTRGLGFIPQAFHLVTCMMGTYNHFTMQERKALLREIGRVLTSEGEVIISLWTRHIKNPLFLQPYKSKRELLEYLWSNIPTDFTEMYDEFQASGFKILKKEMLVPYSRHQLNMLQIQRASLDDAFKLLSHLENNFKYTYEDVFKGRIMVLKLRKGT